MAIDMGLLIMFSSISRAEGLLLPTKDMKLEGVGKPMYTTISRECVAVGRQCKEMIPDRAFVIITLIVNVGNMRKIPQDEKPVQGLEGNAGYNGVVVIRQAESTGGGSSST